ncbi:hypothetical protein ACFLV5_01385 [Chloroflexota bacterium]
MKIATNLCRLGILAALGAVMLLAIALLAFSYVEVGVTDEIGVEMLGLLPCDLSSVPQSVAEDAVRLTRELAGDSQGKYTDFADQLLASYVKAKDKDFIVVFNPGGWGWNLAERSSGWNSILSGIKSELNNLGYSSVMLNYRRTGETMRGAVKEFIEATIDYPFKAKELALRVEFLTAHIPNLKVIVTGESNGTVISDSTMCILRDNPNVYSIQTGSPFWHKSVMVERTLLLNDNGMVHDTFSEGDIPAILWASLKNLFGQGPEEANPGKILYFLRAPGHDYRWQYPDVCSQITGFLERNFGD